MLNIQFSRFCFKNRKHIVNNAREAIQLRSLTMTIENDIDMCLDYVMSHSIFSEQ